MIFAVVLFIAGYALIALEHPLKVHKSATAIMLAAAVWVFYVFAGEKVFLFTEFTEHFNHYQIANPQGSFFDFVAQQELIKHLGEIAEILFFLMGAMTIVEVIDQHGGFSVITDRIGTNNKRQLLWRLSILTFFLAALLDNLTTAIVMCTLLRKLVYNKKERWLFAGLIVLAANSGGIWSPIGDLTTIMLWIGGEVSIKHLVLRTFIPSVVSLLVPLLVISHKMKGNFERSATSFAEGNHELSAKTRNFVFFFGIGCFLFVPVFKSITHLPPFVGMMAALGIFWFVTERLHRKYTQREKYTISNIISKIDTSSILFFLGILLAVAGLQSMGYLNLLAHWLSGTFNDNVYSINIVIGILSSMIDNVPLVAGVMGMYPLSVYPMDHDFWLFLSYCAGAGGNMLIIGSAAGIAVMGMERMDFIWYLKKISLWALIGYLAGAGTFILLNHFVY